MAGRMLSSIYQIVERVCSTCPAKQEASSSPAPCDLVEEVEKLRRTAARIRLVLRDADERDVTEHAVKGWLSELGEVACAAEDLLEEYDCIFLRRAKLTNGEAAGSEVPLSPAATGADISSSGESLLGRIQNCRSSFEEISRECETLRLRDGDGVRRADDRRAPTPTGPYVEESSVYGRKHDKKEVIKRLLWKGQGKGTFDVVPVVGMGGVGKTTLAQLVYGDPGIRKHFDLRAWVHVSQDFDAVRIMRALVEIFSGKACQFEEPSSIHGLLRERLNGKRFLIVMDNVWNFEHQSSWESLCAQLSAGAEGSKVLITTREMRVANTTRTVPLYYLNCLTGDDCWLLFRSRAFEGRECGDQPELEKIGRAIVDKCGGLPLAAKALGSLLRFEDDGERWNDVLQDDLCNIDEGNGILAALKLSYEHLPPHLKHCFAYCSIFPKDHVFRREHLVRLWMANGFVRTVEGKQEEDVGSQYVDELLWRSFFQESSAQVDQQKKGRHLLMHNLMHDLARSISGKECCRIEDSSFGSTVVKETRHASFTPSVAEAAVPSQLQDAPSSLRTLLATRCGGILHVKIPDGAFLKMRSLRSLDLSYTKIKHLPDSVQQLIHLRFLGLNGTKIKGLPQSLCNLHYLQTLEMRGCMKLQELPRNIGDLTSLRHLELPEYVLLPPGVGRLTNLQSLNSFKLQRGKEHCGIGELRDLNNIRGDLCISRLGNIGRDEDAKEAKMEKKKYLVRLMLDWSDYSPCSEVESGHVDDLKTLDGLQPHFHIQEIKISCYGGGSFPSWTSDALYSKLRSVQLDRCSKNCKILPSLGQLPALKLLCISCMDGVKYVGGEFCGHAGAACRGFPSLEVLKFQSMYCWMTWEGVEPADFSCLQALYITDCPQLQGLPRHISSLTKLSIQRCRRMATLPIDLPQLSHLKLEACHQSIWHYLPGSFPSLRSISIAHFETLTTLPLPHLPCIKTLEILNFPALSSISSSCSSLLRLTSLDSVKLIKCPKLPMTEDLTLLSAKLLEIRECPFLEESYPVASDERVLLPSVEQRNLRNNHRKLKEKVFLQTENSLGQCSKTGFPLDRAKKNKRLRDRKFSRRKSKNLRHVQHKDFDLRHVQGWDEKTNVCNSLGKSDAHSFIQFEHLKTTIPTHCLPDLNAKPTCVEPEIHYHTDLMGSQHSWSYSSEATSVMHHLPVDVSLNLKHAAQVDLGLRLVPMNKQLDRCYSSIDLNALPAEGKPIIVDLTYDSDNPREDKESLSMENHGDLNIRMSNKRNNQTAEASGSHGLSLDASNNRNHVHSVTASNFADCSFEPSSHHFEYPH